MPNVAHTTQTFERFLDAIESNDIPIREPVIGSSITVGEAVLTIISPPDSSSERDFNDYSVSLHMTLGSTAFIFTGDAETSSEVEMTQFFISSDVLYVGHHGSSTSTSSDFLYAVDPSIAVISVGSGNRYGHPHDEVLKRLQDIGAIIYRTDHHGNIVIVTNGTDLSVRRQF
jgi:beta-lactamase superfamily II metal-dependent hydrolase